MRIKVTQEQIEGIPFVRIRVQEPLVVGNRQELQEVIGDSVDEEKRMLVLDLSECPYVDSSGFGLFLKMATKAGGSRHPVDSKIPHDFNWKFALANLTLGVQTMIEVTGLIKEIQVVQLPVAA